MNNNSPVTSAHLVPILNVSIFRETVAYFTDKLLFNLAWEYGDPPDFGCVKLDKAEIFLCHDGQGAPGTWMSIFVDDVDGYCEAIKEQGADVVYGPVDEPWGCREIHVRDPNGHIIRFGQGIPATEPKMEIERVPLDARLEKRLVALLSDLADHKNMNISELLEETLLHSFEQIDDDSVAAPHMPGTFKIIDDLKKKHGIDYDTHASYRFIERS